MTSAIHPEVRIGHVHLTVSNLERALEFYRDALGFEVTQRYGTSAVFLSAGGYHHHIGLNTWDGEGIELYRDRPHQEWPRANGELRMTTNPLDLDGLLAELHEPTNENENTG